MRAAVVLLALVVGLLTKSATGDLTTAALSAGLLVVGWLVLETMSDLFDAVGLVRRRSRRRRTRPGRDALERDAEFRRRQRRRAA